MKRNTRQRSFEELLNTAEVKDFLFRAEHEMFPKMADSACSLTIYSGAWDAKLAVELGAALLLDKPIILLAVKGVAIPARLRRIADQVVEVGDVNEPGAKEKVQAALRAVLGERA